jgi:hypothetical protein
MTRNSERRDGRRSRGAQPGNMNALRHGRRSKAAITARKLGTARLKALAHAVVGLGLLREKHRYRIRKLRPDQLQLLERFDTELLDVLRSVPERESQ